MRAVHPCRRDGTCVPCVYRLTAGRVQTIDLAFRRSAGYARTCVSTHLSRRTAFRRRSPTCNRPSPPLWPDGGRWVAKGRARVAGVRAPRVAALSPPQVGGCGTESRVQSHVYLTEDAVFCPPGGRLNVDRRQELFELRVPYAQAARFAVSGGTETGTTFVAAEHVLP